MIYPHLSSKTCANKSNRIPLIAVSLYNIRYSNFIS